MSEDMTPAMGGAAKARRNAPLADFMEGILSDNQSKGLGIEERIRPFMDGSEADWHRETLAAGVHGALLAACKHILNEYAIEDDLFGEDLMALSRLTESLEALLADGGGTDGATPAGVSGGARLAALGDYPRILRCVQEQSMIRLYLAGMRDGALLEGLFGLSPKK